MHQPWRRGWSRRRGGSGRPGRPSPSPATPTYYILPILHILHFCIFAYFAYLYILYLHPPPQLLRPSKFCILCIFFLHILHICIFIFASPSPATPTSSWRPPTASSSATRLGGNLQEILKRNSVVLLERRRSHNWKITWCKCKTRTRRQTRRDSRNMFNPISFFCSSNLLVSHHELNFCTLTVVGWVERSEILVDAHLPDQTSVYTWSSVSYRVEYILIHIIRKANN